MIALATLPGQLVSGSADRYYLLERAGRWALHNHHIAPRSFPTLRALAHTLGGMIPWERWSPEAQAWLEAAGVRGSF